MKSPSITIAALSCATLLAAALPPVSATVPDGWARKDRFSGFRYELSGRVTGVGLLEAIRDEADELACFGWAQETSKGTVVGEARCNKRGGAAFREWMDANERHPGGTFVEGATFLEYDDTLIKLHFSHFKLLDTERETCFPDPPHQCDRFKSDPNYHQHHPVVASREL